jgi:hypothetical protein
MQSQAIKLLIDNDNLNMKKIKKIRMVEFIDTLKKSDKIILDNEKNIIIVDYNIYECSDSNSVEDNSEPDKDPYELSITENTNNDNFSIRPNGPDKDVEHVCNKESKISVNAVNTQINYADYDSSINDSESTIDSDTCSDIDNDIDDSIKKIFHKMEYDKIKKIN